MNRIKKYFHLALTLIALHLLTACGGGSLDQIAQEVLYPYADVNKAYVVPQNPPEGYNNVWFDLVDQAGAPYKIHGWFKKNANPSVNALVYFHGNGENLQSMYAGNFLKVMERLNTHIVVVDYPMYGLSTGTPTEQTLVAAARAAIQFSTTQFNQSKTYVWGRSLGASVAAIAFASEQHTNLVENLILTSPWNDFYSVAKELSSLASQIPKEWLDKNRYNSVAAATQIEKTVLIHHGQKDKLIPIRFGREVAQSFANQELVDMIEFTNREHNDMFLESQLWSDIEQFVKQKNQ